jgi:putative DNA methylase
LAVVAQRDKQRVFHVADDFDSNPLRDIPDLDGVADVPINTSGQGIRVGLYGMDTWAKLFAPRQLLTMATYSALIAEIHEDVIRDDGSYEWAEAVAALLGLAIGKLAHGGSTQNRWKFDSRSGTAKAEAAFGRNDLPMTWDFAEVDPLGDGSMSWKQSVDTMLDALPYAPSGSGTAVRADARTATPSARALVATDPPYFDAIGYADLSDYFYIWHRRALRRVFPALYATVAAPKAGELTAVPSHHGNSKENAKNYFIEGFTETFHNLQDATAAGLPMLVVYASKEQRGVGDERTRWSSILSAMVDADLEITGAWPIHGTGTTRLIGQGTNAVASYIVMVCRPRSQAAATCSLADFNRALRRELGPAVRDLQAASILPVDLGQAAMGPGMQIYSRYRGVFDQSGERVPVGQALRLINSALAEVLDEQEGELDPESRFAVRWWESYGWASASFGEADKTARPLGISVDDVVRAEVATSQANKVQLLGSRQLDRDWRPSKDAVPTAWEAVHHLADRLIDGGGELEAARLMAELGSLQDPAVALAYRLHDIAAKKGRTSDQERYNALISSWSELIRLGTDNVEGLF